MKDRFWIWGPDGGMRFYATKEERDAEFRRDREAYNSDGTWDESIEQTCAGEVQLVATQVDRKYRPPDTELDEDGYDKDGICWDNGMDYHCDYALLPIKDEEKE